MITQRWKKKHKELNSEFHLEEIYQIIVVFLPCNGWLFRKEEKISLMFTFLFQGNNNEGRDQEKTSQHQP